MMKSIPKNQHLEKPIIDFYRQAYDSSPSMMRSIDKNGIIIECNNQYCHNLGYRKDEVIGASIFEHVADNSIDILAKSFLTWKTTGKVGDVTLWLKKQNDDIFPALLSATNIFDANGDFIASNSVIKDIVDLNTMHEKIKKSEKTIKKQYESLLDLTLKKDSFLAMIAHELKTPLVPIKSYSDILLSNSFGDLNPKQRQAIIQIQKSGDSLSSLISDLLDAQKIELSSFKLKQNLHLLDTIICESITNFSQNALKKNILISTSLKPNVLCFCDSIRLQQVLNNLISNAIDFCPEVDGKIDVILRKTDTHAHIVVKDNGIGIQKKSLNKIFSKFYQIDSSLRRTHGGTGLGLTISSGIIKSHGGTIRAKSQGPGLGAEVHVILPLNLEMGGKNV